MDIKNLNYIITIANKKNMTRAAEELYVSHSSLSQFLSKLEQELGTPLFFRAKGELTLTPAGELYVDAANQVIAIQKQLYRNISSIHKRGHINVGTTSMFGLKILSEILPEFNKIYPEYLIEVSELSLPACKKLLVEENIDLAIMAAASLTPFEEYSTILREEEVLLALPKEHDFVKENPSRSIFAEDVVEKLSKEPFIRSKRGSSIRAVVDELFDQYDFNPAILLESNSISTTRDMIAKGAGMAFLAESCAINENKIHYYSIKPKLIRKNVVTRRRNWVMNEAECLLHTMIAEYFHNHTDETFRA